jgi:hypothetical protein
MTIRPCQNNIDIFRKPLDQVECAIKEVTRKNGVILQYECVRNILLDDILPCQSMLNAWVQPSLS